VEINESDEASLAYCVVPGYAEGRAVVEGRRLLPPPTEAPMAAPVPDATLDASAHSTFTP